MKITISTSEVIQAIYANSALRAEAAQWPRGAVAAILSVDDEPALRRMAADAFAATIALTAGGAVAWRIVAADDLALAAECGECAVDQATATALLRSATTAALLAIIWRGLDHRLYAAARDEAAALMQPLTTPSAAPATIIAGY